MQWQLLKCNLTGDHVALEKQQLQEQLPLLPQGAVKDQVLRKIRQLDTFPHIEDWTNSSGLQAPI
jgi:hypothetical protein